MIKLDAWIFGEEGILLTQWLIKRDEFGITACPSIHAAVVASDLRNNSSQSAQPTDLYLPPTNLKTPFLKLYRFNSWIFSNTL